MKPLSERLQEATEPYWQRALSMRFIADVTADTVPDEVFSRYLIFERQFVEVATRTLAAAILRATSRRAVHGHLQTLNALVGEQYAYFDHAIAGLQAAPVIGPRAQAQASQLAAAVMRVADSGTYAQIVTCMLPSEVLYRVWCRSAADSPSARAPIRQWVQMHAGSPFTDGVAFLVAEVDSLPVDDAAVHELAVLMGRILDLEGLFHDAAYIAD